MPKSNFISGPDNDFLVWFEHFIASLTTDGGVRIKNKSALG